MGTVYSGQKLAIQDFKVWQEIQKKIHHDKNAALRLLQKRMTIRSHKLSKNRVMDAN